VPLIVDNRQILILLIIGKINKHANIHKYMSYELFSLIFIDFTISCRVKYTSMKF